MAHRYWRAGLAAGAVFAADQASKLVILERLRLGEAIPVVDGLFNIVHVRNYGAAFGFLNRADTSWQTWFFVASSVLAVGAIVWLLAKAEDHDRPLAWGLGLVLGGAMGNLLDRLRLGNVVDFLDVYWGQHHWPAFNVADAAICVGAGVLLIALTRSGHVSHTH